MTSYRNIAFLFLTVAILSSCRDNSFGLLESNGVREREQLKQNIEQQFSISLSQYSGVDAYFQARTHHFTGSMDEPINFVDWNYRVVTEDNGPRSGLVQLISHTTGHVSEFYGYLPESPTCDSCTSLRINWRVNPATIPYIYRDSTITGFTDQIIRDTINISSGDYSIEAPPGQPGFQLSVRLMKYSDRRIGQFESWSFVVPDAENITIPDSLRHLVEDNHTRLGMNITRNYIEIIEAGDRVIVITQAVDFSRPIDVIE